MNERQKRIRFPLAGWDRSGGLRIVVQVANYLALRGWKVEITIPGYSLKNDSYSLDDSVTLTAIEVGQFYPIAIVRYLLWIVIHACKNVDICVATYYLTAYPIFVSWLLHGRRSQIVYSIQAYEPISRIKFSQRFGVLKPLLFALTQSTYRLPFHRIVASNSTREMIGDQPTTVIPYDIDPSTFFPATHSPAKDQVTVGAIPKNIPLKGYKTLVDVFTALRDIEGLDLLVLVTHPDVAFPVEDVQRVVGDRDEAVAAFYRDCDVFVFTSELEGFGLPPLEAMACGVPVVTTDCGGVREYATDENAIIVAPDDVDALREAILELAQSQELRTHFEEAGLETARRFSIEQMERQYEEFFSGLVDG